MLDTKALQGATIAGTVLQLAMVVAGHFVAFVKMNVFAFGGMAISLAAGFLYGRRASSLGGAALGGALAGGVCALIGIAVSFALHDVPANILVLGTASSAVTGAVGGAIGRLVSGTVSA
ncbi:MAG: hypothetical protein WDM91_05840 [Rhizomicrobium sp.]